MVCDGMLRCAMECLVSVCEDDGVCVSASEMLFVFINLFVCFAIFASYSYWICSSNLLVRQKKMKQMIVVCMQHTHISIKTFTHLDVTLTISFTMCFLFGAHSNSRYTPFRIVSPLSFPFTLLLLLLFPIDRAISNRIVHSMQWTKWDWKRVQMWKEEWEWRRRAGAKKWSNDHDKSNNFQNNNDDEDNMTSKWRRRCKQRS